MKEILIRDFKPEDLKAVHEMLQIIGWVERYVVGQLDAIKTLIQAETGQIAVATDGKCIVGFIQAEHHKWNSLSYIHGLVVHPNFRRMGVASRLVESVETLSKTKSHRGLYVDTPIDNLGGRKFYISAGFREAYTMPEFYGPGLDGITFQKFFAKLN